MISNKDLEGSRFAAIVRKDAKFKNFNDLRGAKACFAGYKSVGEKSIFEFEKDRYRSIVNDFLQAGMRSSPI